MPSPTASPWWRKHGVVCRFACRSSRRSEDAWRVAAGQGVTLTTEDVRGFLLQMDDEEEFDDIELDPIALTAIAGGQASVHQS